MVKLKSKKGKEKTQKITKKPRCLVSCVLCLVSCVLILAKKEEPPKACVNHQPIALWDSRHEKTQLLLLHCISLTHFLVAEEDDPLHFIDNNTLGGINVPSQ